jgi:hypothetical protein
MNKDELVVLLRSVGCDENTVTAMSNAFDIGADWAREECAKIADQGAPRHAKAMREGKSS